MTKKIAHQNKLKQRIDGLYEDLAQQMNQKWQRDLPFDELLFDRWQRANRLGFGDQTSIYHASYVYGKVTVGKHTWVGPFTLLDGTGGLKIGDHCSIAAGVQIYTHDTVMYALSGGKLARETAPVTIGDCCIISPQSVIKSGVSIGDHSVVAACSYVNKDVAPRTIVGGVPAKVIGKVVIKKGGQISLNFQRGNK